jgi:glutaredoxin-related protein
MLRSVTLFLTTTGLTSALVSPTYETIKRAQVIDPSTTTSDGRVMCSPISDNHNKKSLVILLPQLGEFDSSEYCEYLVAVQDQLSENNIDLSVIGIGDTSTNCATRFSQFTGLPLEKLKIDPNATLHRKLDLHAGPNWDVPDGVSDEVLIFLLNQLPGGAPTTSTIDRLRPTARAWLNYLAMCAGIGAPGTLREILRGYFGDVRAPERFAEQDVVQAGFVTIGPGVGPVTLGPLSYSQWWQDERGYQRPVELATVRLKNMVEVLTNWDTYVSNPTTLDQRGATFLFSETGELLYEYRHKGVLTYSETMPRPLMFLAPYIGEDVAKNPLGLLDFDDAAETNKHGRGLLKPAGKFMSFLKPLFALENKLQAQLLGADPEDFVAAKKEIEETIANNHVVVYTYGLSPFSTQAMALLRDASCIDAKQVELGSEWFLLGKEASTTRAALLEMTGQSSLPHVFIGGKHIGGIFSGEPGLAALQESGKLREMLVNEKNAEIVA